MTIPTDSISGIRQGVVRGEVLDEKVLWDKTGGCECGADIEEQLICLTLLRGPYLAGMLIIFPREISAWSSVGNLKCLEVRLHSDILTQKWIAKLTGENYGLLQSGPVPGTSPNDL